MKLGIKSIVLALAVALLCVPAGMAKNGNGHGKPSWAGGSEKSHGKPAWAGVGKGKDHAKHEKVKPENAKHQKAGAEDAAAADDEVNLDDLNPAWYCFTLESMMDAADADAVAGGAEAGEFSSFDSEFGTNDNKRNSHGQCVSRRAHGEDLADALDGSPESCDPAAGEEGTDEGSTSEEPPVDDGTVDDGTVDDGTVDDGTADDPAADEGAEDDSGDQADEADDCQSDDSAGDDSQEDPADDEDATGDEADQGDATDTAAFARALVRFVRL
jgi:hypothetical protein